MQELGLRCKFKAIFYFLARLSFIGVSAFGYKAIIVNALTHCTGVPTAIDLELKLYLTGESVTGGVQSLCSSKHILMDKSLVKQNVDIKSDPTH